MTVPVLYARLFSASPEVTEIVRRWTPLFLMGSIMFFVQMTLQNINVALGQARMALLLAVNRKVIVPDPAVLPVHALVQARRAFICRKASPISPQGL